MLLRLLPTPSASHPTPPTILFTLPLPNHPYTGRSLPLPPNLLAHRSVCLQEDIECPNVLLGEKSSWISGIIDDVTFSLPANTIVVHLIDGSKVDLALTPECRARLLRVCREVELSFAPQPSSSSDEEASTSRGSIPTGRRSPSSLLYSLISPLFPNNQSQSFARQQATPNPARVHRRQARSFLVDTYRAFVLPELKSSLPKAYLPWAISSETKQRMVEFETLKNEVQGILTLAGMDQVPLDRPLKLSRSSSTGSELSSEASFESEADSTSPSTPATSIYSSREASSTPQSFLLSIPPAHALPVAQRTQYSTQLQRLTSIASRVHAIKKLNSKYEREEGKRKWLENLERGRLGDRALKKAYSNGQLRGACVSAEPMRASRLWRSWTAEDEERASHGRDLMPLHPAMMEDVSDAEASAEGSDDGVDAEGEDVDMESESGSEESLPVTPTGTSLTEVIGIRIATSTQLEAVGAKYAESLSTSPEEISKVINIRPRPSLQRESYFERVEEEVVVDDPLRGWEEDDNQQVEEMKKLKLSTTTSNTGISSKVPVRFNNGSNKPQHRVLDWTRATCEVMA